MEAIEAYGFSENLQYFIWILSLYTQSILDRQILSYSKGRVCPFPGNSRGNNSKIHLGGIFLYC